MEVADVFVALVANGANPIVRLIHPIARREDVLPLLCAFVAKEISTNVKIAKTVFFIIVRLVITER